MRVLITSILVLLGFSLVQAQKSEKVTVKNGGQAISKTGRITVKFLEMIEDSRCPADVSCVWAGVARIKIRLTRKGKSSDFELNTNQADKPAVFQGYSVALKDLEPRQSTTSKYSPSAYSVTLIVKKI